MKVLQWSMTIPKGKQEDFVKTAKSKFAPTWKKFGCVKYELLKVEEEPVVGKSVLERDQYIERLYFNDNFELFNPKIKSNNLFSISM